MSSTGTNDNERYPRPETADATPERILGVLRDQALAKHRVPRAERSAELRTENKESGSEPILRRAVYMVSHKETLSREMAKFFPRGPDRRQVVDKDFGNLC